MAVRWESCWFFLCGFAAALIVTSRRLNLYSPIRLNNALREQRLSVQACLTSGLLLTGALYLVHAEDIPRSIVLITVGLVTVALSLRRLVYRILLYRKFERGVGTRNVLIVGTGPEARALRYYLESIRHLGYRFKGFIESPGSGARFAASSENVVGTFDTLFQDAHKLFVDEIFFTTPCERSVVQDVLAAGSRPRRGPAHRSGDVRRPCLEQRHRIHRPLSRPFRCIGATCRRWGCCSSARSTSCSPVWC